MCGIVGALGLANSNVLEEMLKTIVHRGPDEKGVHIDDSRNVMLGVRRLSIVDIGGGSQPMWNEDKNICVTFNGEIYNHETLRENLINSGHKFSSRCDTEVLVHLYEEHGEEMLTLIDGMFAFSIWDAERKQVLIARDRMGIKPLYYASLQSGFAWASELPALLKTGVSRKISETAVNEYLSLSYVNHPRTIVESIYKLPPGSAAVIDNEGVSVDQYWKLNPEPTVKSSGVSTSEIKNLLTKAVEKRLMADVPVGAFLSGGLDSAAIVGIMSDISEEPVNTYSIKFDNATYDESEFSNTVAAEFGTKHNVISTDPADLDIFEQLVTKMNEPTPDPSIIPAFILSKRAAEDLKVIQNGTGADEIFSGYDQWNKVARQLESWNSLPKEFFSVMDQISNILPVLDGKANHISTLNEPSAAIENFYNGEWREDYEQTEDWVQLDQNKVELTSKESVSSMMRRNTSSPGEAIYQYLIIAQLPNRLLHNVDTASMNASLEARVPFLDRELVEAAMGVPHHIKTDGSYKPVLRKAVKEFVPKSVREREKTGFSVPVSEWIKQRRAPVEKWLATEKLRSTPYINANKVRSAYAEHYSGRSSHYRMLFRILVYVSWYHTVIKDDTAHPEPS